MYFRCTGSALVYTYMYIYVYCILSRSHFGSRLNIGFAFFQTIRVATMMNPWKFNRLFLLLHKQRGSEATLTAISNMYDALKLVSCLIAGAGFAIFFHANTYADTKGAAFGVLSALSCVVACFSLMLSVMHSSQMNFLDPRRENEVEDWLKSYSHYFLISLLSIDVSIQLQLACLIYTLYTTYGHRVALIIFVVVLVSTVKLLHMGNQHLEYMYKVRDESDTVAYKQLSREVAPA